jgi:hypothetical protein
LQHNGDVSPKDEPYCLTEKAMATTPVYIQLLAAGNWAFAHHIGDGHGLEWVNCYVLVIVLRSQKGIIKSFQV